MPDPSPTFPVHAPFVELTLARLRELLRSPEAIFWGFGFPLALTAIIDLAFRGTGYVDFLVPGLIGLMVMGSGMSGVGFPFVIMRNSKILKRLVAAPARRADVLAAYVAARMIFLAGEVGCLILVARLLFGVPLRGSPAALAALLVLGSLSFSSLGLLAAARAQTIEGYMGILNLLTIPMWILSGLFFATSRFPAGVQPFVNALPLTILNDGVRAIMLDGAGVSSRFVLLALWGVASFAAALRLFRWQ
jgi:ABC-2 type transport system permease protein